MYANNSDFENHKVSSIQLHERIDLAIARALPLIQRSVVETAAITHQI